MKNAKKPMGIKINRIYLDRVDFTIRNLNPGKQEIPVSVDLDAKPEFKNNMLFQHLLFSVDTEVFSTKGIFVGIFTADKGCEDNLKKFAEANAPAYIIPYLRELLVNLTSRAAITPFILQPIDVVSYFESKKKALQAIAKKVKA